MKRRKQGIHLSYIQTAVEAIKAKNKPLNPESVMSEGMIECLKGSERFTISGAEAVDAFWGLVSKLQSQPEWRNKFSENYISKELMMILARLSTGTPESLIPHLEEFIKGLQEFKEVHELVIPIQGLRLEVEAFRLGRTTFRPTNKSQIDQLTKRTEKIIKTLRYSDEEKVRLLGHYQHVIETRLGAFEALAFSESVAEVYQARVNALQDIDVALSVLKFLTPHTQELSKRVSIGMPGQFTAATYSSIVFSENGFNTNFPSTGRHRPFKVDDQFLERHGEALVRLSEIIESQSRSEIEERILVAIQWAGRAQSDSQSQQQLLSLITALECLLNPTDGRPNRIGLSESAVFLIGPENLEGRLKLCDFLVSMYDVRSMIIHGGTVKPTDSDIASLQQVVGAVIMKVTKIRHKYITRKALEAHLKLARLGAKADL